MRNGLDFPAVSRAIGGPAAAIASGAVVEGVAERVASGPVLVAASSPRLVRASAAIAPPTGRPSADAVGAIAASAFGGQRLKPGTWRWWSMAPSQSRKSAIDRLGVLAEET